MSTNSCDPALLAYIKNAHNKVQVRPFGPSDHPVQLDGELARLLSDYTLLVFSVLASDMKANPRSFRDIKEHTPSWNAIQLATKIVEDMPAIHAALLTAAEKKAEEMFKLELRRAKSKKDVKKAAKVAAALEPSAADKHGEAAGPVVEELGDDFGMADDDDKENEDPTAVIVRAYEEKRKSIQDTRSRTCLFVFHEFVPNTAFVMRERVEHRRADLRRLVLRDGALLCVRIHVYYLDPRLYTTDLRTRIQQMKRAGVLAACMRTVCRLEEKTRDKEAAESDRRRPYTYKNRMPREDVSFKPVDSVAKLLQVCKEYNHGISDSVLCGRFDGGGLPIDTSHKGSMLDVFSLRWSLGLFRNSPGFANPAQCDPDLYRLSSGVDLDGNPQFIENGVFAEPHRVWRISPATFLPHNFMDYVFPHAQILIEVEPPSEAALNRVFNGEVDALLVVTKCAKRRNDCLGDTTEAEARQFMESRVSGDYTTEESRRILKKVRTDVMHGLMACMGNKAQEVAVPAPASTFEELQEQGLRAHHKMNVNAAKNRDRLEAKRQRDIATYILAHCPSNATQDAKQKLEDFKRTTEARDKRLQRQFISDQMVEHQEKFVKMFQDVIDNKDDMSNAQRAILDFGDKYLKRRRASGKPANFCHARPKMWDNLSVFANEQARKLLEAEDVFGIVAHHLTFWKLGAMHLHTYSGEPFHMHGIMQGPPGVGKSWLIKQLMANSIDGTCEILADITSKALLVDKLNLNDTTILMEEAPRRIFGVGDGSYASKAAAEGDALHTFFKSLMASGFMQQRSNAQADDGSGIRKELVTFSRLNATVIAATNDDLAKQMAAAMMSRNMLLNCPAFDDDETIRRILTAKSPSLMARIREAIDRNRRSEILFWTAAKMIYSNILRIDLTAGDLVFAAVLTALQKEGLVTTQVRDLSRLRMELWVLVVETAIARIFDYDKTIIDDVYGIRQLLRIEPFLCATTEMAAFVMQTLSTQYEHPMLYKVVKAIEREFEHGYADTPLVHKNPDKKNAAREVARKYSAELKRANAENAHIWSRLNPINAELQRKFRDNTQVGTAEYTALDHQQKALAAEAKRSAEYVGRCKSDYEHAKAVAEATRDELQHDLSRCVLNLQLPASAGSTTVYPSSKDAIAGKSKTNGANKGDSTAKAGTEGRGGASKDDAKHTSRPDQKQRFYAAGVDPLRTMGGLLCGKTNDKDFKFEVVYEVLKGMNSANRRVPITPEQSKINKQANVRVMEITPGTHQFVFATSLFATNVPSRVTHHLRKWLSHKHVAEGTTLLEGRVRDGAPWAWDLWQPPMDPTSNGVVLENPLFMPTSRREAHERIWSLYPTKSCEIDKVASDLEEAQRCPDPSMRALLSGIISMDLADENDKQQPANKADSNIVLDILKQSSDETHQTVINDMHPDQYFLENHLISTGWTDARLRSIGFSWNQIIEEATHRHKSFVPPPPGASSKDFFAYPGDLCNPRVFGAALHAAPVSPSLDHKHSTQTNSASGMLRSRSAPDPRDQKLSVSVPLGSSSSAPMCVSTSSSSSSVSGPSSAFSFLREDKGKEKVDISTLLAEKAVDGTTSQDRQYFEQVSRPGVPPGWRQTTLGSRDYDSIDSEDSFKAHAIQHAYARGRGVASVGRYYDDDGEEAEMVN